MSSPSITAVRYRSQYAIANTLNVLPTDSDSDAGMDALPWLYSLRPDVGLTPDASGGVQSITDKLGGAGSYQQSPGSSNAGLMARRPVVTLGGANGWPYLAFDGGVGNAQGAANALNENGLSLTAASAFTVYAVVRLKSLNGNRTIWGTTGTSDCRCLTVTSTGALRLKVGTYFLSVDVSQMTSKFVAILGTFDGTSNGTLRVGELGVLTASNFAAPTASTALTLGNSGSSTATSSAMQMDLSEFRLAAVDMSGSAYAASRQSIEDYTGERYAIPAALV